MGSYTWPYNRGSNGFIALHDIVVKFRQRKTYEAYWTSFFADSWPDQCAGAGGAIDSATIDHRGPAFQKLGREVLVSLNSMFKTWAPVVIFPFRVPARGRRRW